MKKLSIVVTILICLAFITVSLSALGLQHVSITGGLFNTIQAGFAESQYGTGLFGTNPTTMAGFTIKIF